MSVIICPSIIRLGLYVCLSFGSSDYLNIHPLIRLSIYVCLSFSIHLPRQVGSFSIREPSACKDTSDICVEVPLTRLWGNAVLTMYTPSLILLVLSYMTLFFDPSLFEVRIMAALTSLLVMATFFTQVTSCRYCCSCR